MIGSVCSEWWLNRLEIELCVHRLDQRVIDYHRMINHTVVGLILGNYHHPQIESPTHDAHPVSNYWMGDKWTYQLNLSGNSSSVPIT